MICVQNEINSELNGSVYIKKRLVLLANKDHVLKCVWLTFKVRLPQS